MRDRLPNFITRLGARGFLMLVCAYIWAWLGLGNYRDVISVRPDIPHLGIEPITRALMWWAGPVVAVCTAGLRKGSILGLAALAFMPCFVIASYGISYVWWYVPGGHAGYAEAWYSAGIYLALPALVLASALIPAPPTRIIAVPEDFR